MIKQIAIVATIGLLLTVATLTTIYPQHVFAARNVGGGTFTFNGITGGQTPPGPYCANSPVGQHNPNC